MNQSQFKVSGLARRKMKKELNSLKSVQKNFWHFHQLDKDMTAVYGRTNTYPMSDEDAQKNYDKRKEEIVKIQLILSELAS